MVKKKKKINLFILIMLSSAFVISIRNIPAMAETRLQVFFFGIIAALFFFIPTALISAELATGWSREGGIFVWVTEAFGKKWGFWASWLQWTSMLLNVITMLFFVGGSLAYVINPALADSKIFLLVVILIVLWGVTFLSLKGIRTSGLFSAVCFIGGVLFPIFLIVLLAFIYLLKGNLSYLTVSMDFFPDFKRITTLVLILGFALTFAGIEASASHAGRVIKPHRNYPIAIFLVVVLGLLVNLLGACSIAIVVPKGAISMVSGIMEAFDMFLSKLGVRWFVPFIGILVAGGAIGGINAWLTGPVQGLLETAKKGDLPPIFRKVNKNGVPIDLLFMQGILISLIAIVLMMSPNPNIAFWISVDLTVTIYLAMYFMMMLSGIYLRYKRPNVLRTYRIPGKKNIGMWIVSSVGMIAILCFFSVALFPPKELPKEGHVTYFIIILFSLSLVFSIPFIIEKYKKRSWAERKRK